MIIKNGALRGRWLDAVVTAVRPGGTFCDISTQQLTGDLAIFSNSSVQGVPAADLRHAAAKAAPRAVH